MENQNGGNQKSFEVEREAEEEEKLLQIEKSIT